MLSFLPKLTGEVILIYLGLGRVIPGEDPGFQELSRSKDAGIYRLRETVASEKKKAH